MANEKEIKVIISVRELMHELARWAYTVGENLPDDQAKTRHFIQGLADRGHAELIKQRIDQAWVDVLDTVSAYLISHACKCDCAWCKAHPDDCGCDCKDCQGPVPTDDGDYCPNCGQNLSSGEGVDEMGCVVPADSWMWQDYVMTLHFPANVYPALGRRITVSARTYMAYQARCEWETLTGRDNAQSEIQSQRALNRLRVTIQVRTNIGKTNTGWDNFIKF